MSTTTIEGRVRDLESFAFQTGKDMTEIKDRLTTLTTDVAHLREVADKTSGKVDGLRGEVGELRREVGELREETQETRRGVDLLLAHYGILKPVTE